MSEIPVILRSHFLELVTMRIIQYEKLTLHKNEKYRFTEKQVTDWVNYWLKQKSTLNYLIERRWTAAQYGRLKQMQRFIIYHLQKDCKNLIDPNLQLQYFWEPLRPLSNNFGYGAAMRARWGELT